MRVKLSSFSTLSKEKSSTFVENYGNPCSELKKMYICNPIFWDMANHKSAIKRIRSNDAKRLRNKYFHKTTRNAVRKLRSLTAKKEASELLPKVVAMLDKLAKTNVIHKNKASNLKSGLTVFVNGLK